MCLESVYFRTHSLVPCFTFPRIFLYKPWEVVVSQASIFAQFLLCYILHLIHLLSLLFFMYGILTLWQSLMGLSMWCPTAPSVGYRGPVGDLTNYKSTAPVYRTSPITKFPCRRWRLLGISHIQCTYAVYGEHGLFWDIFRGTCVIESLTTGASSLSEPPYNTPLMGGGVI